ncbi:phosphoethanolamine transferase [Empedobacter tilapiae]
MKNLFTNYWSIIVIITLYLIGYFIAYPHILRAFIYFYSLGDTLVDIFEKLFVFVILLIFMGVLFKNNYLKIIGYVLMLLITINFTLSLYIRLIFKKDFDTGLALSFIGTNKDEAFGLLKDLTIYPFIIIGIIFFLLLLKALKKISTINFRRKDSIIFCICFFVIIIYHFVGYKTVYYQKNLEKFREDKRTYFSNLYPVYYLNEFIVSEIFVHDLKEIKKIKVDFSKKEYIENDLETLVLVIGESARKENMSLYGYKRNTTPNEVRERENMLIYENAVSPGPLTLISIPMILSNAMPDDYSFSSPKYADNVLTLANYLDFDTYWITTQKFPGQEVSLISIFENYAKNIKRIDGVYDELILPAFYESLKNKNKKLIILHINGSHMTYCDKYPPTEAYFKESPNNIDCYDNSIRYTDKVLGKIFDKLKDSKAAVVYVSDHGTSFYNNKMSFSNTKDQTKIPMYIWYSNVLNHQKNKFQTGKISELTQSTIIYEIISNLLGIHNHDLSNKKYTDNLRFVNSDLTVSNYDDLKDKL